MPGGELSSEGHFHLQLFSLHRTDIGGCEIFLRFFKFPKNLLLCQVNLCGEEDDDCVKSLSLTESAGDCPNRCEGIIIEVRKEQVQRFGEEGFKDLLNEYQNYECENYTDLIFTEKISGIVTRFISCE